MARVSCPLRWEAVPDGVADLLRGLSASLEQSDFYLAGGTALALQLGHRISEDLDLFSPTSIARSRLSAARAMGSSPFAAVTKPSDSASR